MTNDVCGHRLTLVSLFDVKEAEALAYKNEHAANGETILHGGAFFERYESHADWLRHLRDCSDETTVRPGLVPSDVFFAVRKSDGAVVGMLDVRRRLNDALQNYGGHIGYGVRPSARGQRVCFGNSRTGP